MKHLIGFVLFLTLTCYPAQSQYERYDNPNPTQYLIGGTAFNLNKGTFLYKNTWLVLNSLTYGFTDNVSLTVGSELYTTLKTAGKYWTPRIHVSPKVGFELLPHLNISGAYEVVYLPEGIFQDDSNDGVKLISIGSGLLTYGTANNNVTAGVYSFATNELFRVQTFIFNLSGMVRIGRKVAVIAETWYADGRYQLLDGGFRFFGKRSAVDLGIGGFNSSMFPYPYLDYTLKF